MVTSQRVLVVEDESIISMYIQESLNSLGHIVAGTASRGEDAVTKALQIKPDLTMMDIRLKGKMDGITAATEIRKKIDIPIIFLSAFSDQETFNSTKCVEPYGFLIKPFKIEDLQNVIQAAHYKHSVEGWSLKLSRELNQAIQGIAKFNREMDLSETSFTHYFKLVTLSLSDGILRRYHKLLDRQARDYFNQIYNANLLMSEAIEYLTRIVEIRAKPIEVGIVDLTRLAQEVVTNLKESAPFGDVEFVISKNLSEMGDENLLKLAIKSLIESSWRFISDNSRTSIELGAKKMNGKLCYYIQNSESEAERKSGRLRLVQNLNNPMRLVETGIGLLKAQYIIRRHRGEFWVEDQPEKGLRFCFTLGL